MNDADRAEGARLLAEARAATDGPWWAFAMVNDRLKDWLYQHADDLLADSAALAGREPPEVAVAAAELARVARDIGATAAGYDNVALSGETLAAWRDRIAHCAASVAALAERDGEIARLRAEVERLQKALTFYAQGWVTE